MKHSPIQICGVLLCCCLFMTACTGSDIPILVTEPIQEEQCGDGICSSDETTESCAADCATQATPLPTMTQEIDPLGYVTFVIKVSDFVNANESAATLLQIIDLFARNEIRAEFFLTGPMTHKYLSDHPEVIERLRDSGMIISYHVLPPHPLVPGFQAPLEISAINLKEQRINAYESNRLDLTTGDLMEQEAGGYRHLAEVFEAPPSAVSIPDDPIKGFALPLFAGMGASMVVLYNEPGAALDQPFTQEYSMWVRPVDLQVSHWPVEGVDASMAWWDMLASDYAAAYQPAARLQSVAEAWQADRLPFITVTLDEYNFYREGSAPWTMIYYRDPSLTQANSPPFDLTAPDISSPRTPENREAVWEAYVAMVEWAAVHMKVVTSADIVELATASQ